jgi:hypothetical protein
VAVTAVMDMYPINKIPVSYNAAFASKLAPTRNLQRDYNPAR